MSIMLNHLETIASDYTKHLDNNFYNELQQLEYKAQTESLLSPILKNTNNQSIFITKKHCQADLLCIRCKIITRSKTETNDQKLIITCKQCKTTFTTYPRN